MNDDLVNYLRALANGVMHWVTVERMAREAVDRIEALEAALREIAANTCCDSCREAALVARKALERKDD